MTTKKFVAVLNKKIETGKVMNARAQMKDRAGEMLSVGGVGK